MYIFIAILRTSSRTTRLSVDTRSQLCLYTGSYAGIIYIIIILYAKKAGSIFIMM